MSFIKGFKKGTKNFGNCITAIINALLLTIVYIIGVGISSVFAKFFSKHFLDTKLKGKSYWTKLNLKRKPMDEYYRQF